MCLKYYPIQIMIAVTQFGKKIFIILRKKIVLERKVKTHIFSLMKIQNKREYNCISIKKHGETNMRMTDGPHD